MSKLQDKISPQTDDFAVEVEKSQPVPVDEVFGVITEDGPNYRNVSMPRGSP
jgi:hypothetical protein